MRIYSKLVRDKIPEIIKASGKNSDVHYTKKEELADVIEVLFALANTLGYSEKDLINKRNAKKNERGGFEKGIFLEKVYE